jgi:hypothetical protein
VIPAVLCVDVEPDSPQPSPSDIRWRGFDDTWGLVERVRQSMAEAGLVPLRPTWFFRMDPQIEAVYGRADHAIESHRDLVERIVERGDRFGIHVHTYRWDDTRRAWYSDLADPRWARHCIVTAAEAFHRVFGCSPPVVRMGGYFAADAVYDAFVDIGARVDFTVEPGLPPIADDRSHAWYSNGPSTDFRRAPRTRYVPSRHDALFPAAGADDARAITIVPLLSGDFWSHLLPKGRAIVRRVVRRPPRHAPMSPWRAWPDAATYWTLVARALDELTDPVAAFAIRTHPAHASPWRNSARVLLGLFAHPLATRLEFVDPERLDLVRSVERRQSDVSGAA